MTQGTRSLLCILGIAMCAFLSVNEGNSWSGGWNAGIAFCLTLDLIFDNPFKK